jgi:hypothetical protein
MLQVVPIPYQLAAQKKELTPAPSVPIHCYIRNCGVGTLIFDLLFEPGTLVFVGSITTMPEETQVMVRFTTRLPPDLQVPLTEVVRLPGASCCQRCCLLLNPNISFFPCSQAVPASLKRYGLSQIINHLLALGETPLIEEVQQHSAY